MTIEFKIVVNNKVFSKTKNMELHYNRLRAKEKELKSTITFMPMDNDSENYHTSYFTTYEF